MGNASRRPPRSAGLLTAALFLMLVGGLLMVGLSTIGAGAFLLSRAGTRPTDYVGRGGASAPARLDTEPVLELFFKHGLILIRCTDNAIELHVAKPISLGTVPLDRLAKALGGAWPAHG